MVVRGRCLPYGEGITFWPIAEAVRAAAGIGEDDPPERAREKVLRLAGGDVEVADRVASAIGLVPTVYAVEEMFFGVRRLFEILAAERPLVAVHRRPALGRADAARSRRARRRARAPARASSSARRVPRCSTAPMPRRRRTVGR